jgi:hypothetical protein
MRMFVALLVLAPSLAAAPVTVERLLVSIGDALGVDDTLVSLAPDGTDRQPLFDFHEHPKHTTGRVLTPRIAPDGQHIYFCSDHAFVYTPASRNLFRIRADGSGLQQLTPGPCSGIRGAEGPTGVVAGTVARPDGTPWGGCPVYLEGMAPITSQPDGTFRFPAAPVGERWLLAYRPGSQVFDAAPVTVVAGTTARADLVPRSDYRTSFMAPALWGTRVYLRVGTSSLQWLEGPGAGGTEVFSASGQSVLPADVDGFDLCPRTGRLAIMDYQDGCPTNRGLYLADQDGGGLRLLLDLKQDPEWCGATEVFWSPDGSRLAIKGCYGWHTGVMVVDPGTGQVLGAARSTDQNHTLYNLVLHGWSPDGRWLLYSHWLGSTANGHLTRIRVQEDGQVDATSAEDLLAGVACSGATWGRLAPLARRPPSDDE